MFFACRKNRVIVFYPDLGAFDKWNQKPEVFNKMGYNIKTSNLLELKATSNDKTEGFDIAGYIVKNKLIVLKPNKSLLHMININPSLQTLIDTFQLVLAR